MKEIEGEEKILNQEFEKTFSGKEEVDLFAGAVDVLNKIIVLLRKISGINFAEYKQLTIKRRILRRMGLLRIEKINDYVIYLQDNSTELIALQQDILINVTKFFRDPQAFDTLKNLVFPSIISNTMHDTPIRLWVPGCSTGEEAYSMAIALLEFLENNNLNRRIQIFATDVNEAVIEQARSGIYAETIIEDISSSRISRFFVAVDQGYQVTKEIRDLCVFARQDIGQDPPISRVDLVSCRNVMIYFGPALHKRIFPIFHYALNSNGFLLLGASESIGGFVDLFALVDKKHRIYNKKSVMPPVVFDFSVAEHVVTMRQRGKNELEGGKGTSWLEVHKEADRIVIAKYSPPGVIINSKLDIIQFRGRTGTYLEPAAGTPSVNLLKMAKDGLFAGLRTAINQAKKDNVLVKKEGLHVIKNGHSVAVRVDVIPINGSFQKGEYFLVLFREATSRAIPDSLSSNNMVIAQVADQSRAQDEVLQLKQEVAATKEYLQSIIDQHESTNEDLRYANEEVQSSNEELQSMNEEIETAKEELQSTNEELMTLNEELGTRNMELNHVNNDMMNLLRSINLPVLILSNDLRIRRFNTAAEKVFNLIGADVGRPINNIKPNIDVPDLEQVSLQVIDTLHSIERDVQDRCGQWYSMQIRPYRTTDNKIDGVIITFADINAIKKSIQAIQEAKEYAEAIVETVRHPMVVLSEELRVKTANKAFYQTFGMVPGEVNGELIFQIKDNQLDLAELYTLLTELRDNDRVFENFELTADFYNMGKITMLLNARQIMNVHNNTKLILMAFETLPC